MSIATALYGCLIISTCSAQAGDADRVTLENIANALKKRDQLFFESDSIHIKCAWGPTDHALLDENEEAVLLGLMKRNELDAITSQFPRQCIMRTPGYQYEYGKRGSKLYQKVVNPLDLKYGPLGLIGVYDGQIGLELQERSHATIEPIPSPYSWQGWDYAFLLHLNILSYVTGLDIKTQIPPAKRPINLQEEIEQSPGDYKIAGHETIDGVDCIVLEKTDVARFWMDPSKEYAFRRIDHFAAGKDHAIGSLMTSSVMTDYREVKPGLWLPWAITEEMYFTSDRGAAELVGKPALHRTLSVQSLEFDTLSDEFFHVPLPDGVMVHDNIRKLHYVNQQSGVPFEKAIDFANQHLEKQKRPYLGLIIGNVVLCVIVWLCLRRQKTVAK